MIRRETAYAIAWIVALVLLIVATVYWATTAPNG